MLCTSLSCIFRHDDCIVLMPCLLTLLGLNVDSSGQTSASSDVIMPVSLVPLPVTLRSVFPSKGLRGAFALHFFFLNKSLTGTGAEGDSCYGFNFHFLISEV